MTCTLPAGTRLAMLLRSLLLQGSFNYRNLIGTGFAFVMLPALRHLYRGRTQEFFAALRRHQQPFNSHPYLVGVAAGAVTRMETDGAAPEVIERFKSALRGPLGSLGDGLFWAGLRPLCLLLALLLLFLGAPWWAAVLAFLLPYNIGHLAVRSWAFRAGFEHGVGVAAGLRSTRVVGMIPRFAQGGAFLVGLLLPLVVVAGMPDGTSLPPRSAGVAVFAALLGLALGDRIRPAAALVLGVVVLLALAWGGLS